MAIARELLASDRQALPERPLHPVDEGEEGLEPDADRAKTFMHSIRIRQHEMDSIRAVAGEHGLSPSEWIRHIIRWHLWGKAEELRIGRSAARGLAEVAKQIRAIGVNINQAVHAMNSAAQADKAGELAIQAKGFMELAAQLRLQIAHAIDQVRLHGGREVAFWTNNYHHLKPSHQPENGSEGADQDL